MWQNLPLPPGINQNPKEHEMSVSWSISKQHRLVVWHFDDLLIADEIIETAATLSRHKDHNPEFDELAVMGKNCDLSALDLDSIKRIITGDIKLFDRDLRKINMTIAVVSSRPINRYFMEFFSVYSEDHPESGVMMVLCKSLSEAADVLGRDQLELTKWLENTQEVQPREDLPYAPAE